MYWDFKKIKSTNVNINFSQLQFLSKRCTPSVRLSVRSSVRRSIRPSFAADFIETRKA